MDKYKVLLEEKRNQEKTNSKKKNTTGRSSQAQALTFRGNQLSSQAIININHQQLTTDNQ